MYNRNHAMTEKMTISWGFLQLIKGKILMLNAVYLDKAIPKNGHSKKSYNEQK